MRVSVCVCVCLRVCILVCVDVLLCAAAPTRRWRLVFRCCRRLSRGCPRPYDDDDVDMRFFVTVLNSEQVCNTAVRVIAYASYCLMAVSRDFDSLIQSMGRMPTTPSFSLVSPLCSSR